MTPSYSNKNYQSFKSGECSSDNDIYLLGSSSGAEDVFDENITTQGNKKKVQTLFLDLIVNNVVMVVVLVLIFCVGLKSFTTYQQPTMTTTSALMAQPVVLNNKKKKSWKVFWDLQCIDSKEMWEYHMKDIQTRFDSEYDITIHITSLIFHQQAFTAQCGAALIEKVKGKDAMLKYVDACFQNQELFTNKAMIDRDAKKSDIDEVFAGIADNANVFDEKLTKETFLYHLHNWDMAVQPADNAVKLAYGYGVWGAPKNVIDDKLVITDGTEKTWGPTEWEEKLKTL